jgi:hypothetical protein
MERPSGTAKMAQFRQKVQNPNAEKRPQTFATQWLNEGGNDNLLRGIQVALSPSESGQTK